MQYNITHILDINSGNIIKYKWLNEIKMLSIYCTVLGFKQNISKNEEYRLESNV